MNIQRPRRAGQRAGLAVAGIFAAGMLVGCTVQSPPEHDERLSKAAGLARVTLVCPKDLWNETKPDSRSLNEVKASVTEVDSGDRAGRGLVRVTMSGTNLVAYLKELDGDAHPAPAFGEEENTAAARRVYDAVAPAIDRIKGARSKDDPEPEILIDDTISDKK